MSIPLKHCLVIKAVDGDEQALKFVYDALTKNLAHGAFTVMPCSCEPPCRTPTEDDMEDLIEMLMQLEKSLADPQDLVSEEESDTS